MLVMFAQWGTKVLDAYMMANKVYLTQKTNHCNQCSICSITVAITITIYTPQGNFKFTNIFGLAYLRRSKKRSKQQSFPLVSRACCVVRNTHHSLTPSTNHEIVWFITIVQQSVTKTSRLQRSHKHTGTHFFLLKPKTTHTHARIFY